MEPQGHDHKRGLMQTSPVVNIQSTSGRPVQVDPESAAEMLAALEMFIEDHEASGNFCEGLNAAWLRARAIVLKVKGLR